MERGENLLELKHIQELHKLFIQFKVSQSAFSTYSWLKSQHGSGRKPNWLQRYFCYCPFSFPCMYCFGRLAPLKCFFCQKTTATGFLQHQLLCCLCKHCLVLVCLMAEAQHCQKRTGLCFKHSRILQSCRIVEGTITTKSTVLDIVAKYRVPVMKFLFSQRLLDFEVNKRFSNGSKDLRTKEVIFSLFLSSQVEDWEVRQSLFPNIQINFFH